MERSRRSCARAFSLSLIALAFSFSCGKKADPPAPAASASAASAASSSAPVASSAAPIVDAAPPDPLAGYDVGEPVSGRSIGHTSLVFKLKLDNGKEAAFKPRSRKALGTTRYKAEIAAYRFAKALGLPNVPAALPRTFTMAQMRKALSAANDARAWEHEAAPLPDGKVPGALIPWLSRFTPFNIEDEPDLSRWRAWLMVRKSEIPETATLDGTKVPAARIAGQLSTMIVFDYLTANWDRWSGGNVGLDKTSDTVLFVDNDGAFYETPNQANLNEQHSVVQKMHRFSRGFVTALRALDEAKIRAAIGDETPGAPLLPPKVIAGIEERRAKVLGVIDAKIAADGEGAVLAFE